METIDRNNCKQLGYIQKPHGINGELVLSFQEEYYDSLENATILFVEIEQLLVPFFITEDGLRFRTADSALVKFLWIDNERQAAEIAGCSVFIPQSNIVEDSDSLTIGALIGFTLIDQRKTQIGIISGISDFSGNILLEIDRQGKELLIPFNEDFLLHLDPDNKVIALDLPDGILSLD